MVLRFIPYVGVWVAAAMPALLAFAISDGWTPVAWTVGVFFALELVLAYVVEPWLYGKSAGLSPIAIILAVLFWTWLWGPVGLLLATPLTVCVAVIGPAHPGVGYLNVLLGVEPVLTPERALLPAPGGARPRGCGQDGRAARERRMARRRPSTK